MKTFLMKKIIVIISSVFSFALFSQNRSMEFDHGTWNEALAKATKENKPVFVDAYTTWCGPCKWMTKNVFTNDTVADFYNKNYVCVKMDMEKGEGVDLAKQWGVKAYPTLLFFDSKGDLIHRACGSMENQKFIQLGKDATDPAKQFKTKKKLVESGKASNQAKADYIVAMSKACMDYEEELKTYFVSQKETDLLSQENWYLMNWLVKDPYSREFQYLLSNKTAFQKIHTEDSVNKKIENVYSGSLYGLSYKDDDEKFAKMKEEVRKSGIVNSEKIILSADMSFYAHKKDWDNYAKSSVNYIDKYALNNADVLNNVAWGFYENVSDKTMIEYALRWAKKSIDIKQDYANTDTYAALLYKSGNTKDAKTQAEKAIELAKKENTDYKGTQELLDKINTGIK